MLGHSIKAVRREKLEEGGLADAVAPDEAILTPRDERHVHLLEQLQPVDVHRNPLEQDVRAARAAAAPVQHDGLARQLAHELLSLHIDGLLTTGGALQLLLAAPCLLPPPRHRLLALVLLNHGVDWATVRDARVDVHLDWTEHLRTRRRARGRAWGG